MTSKTILVTGASGNLGQAVVKYFLSQDHQVIGFVHHQTENTQPQKNYEEVAIDLLEESAVANAIDKLTEKYKTIDVAVLTAGGFAMGNIANTTGKDLDYQYALNFKTAYHVARPVIKHMKTQQQGILFFTGSLPGMKTQKGKATLAYSLAKSQLFQLTNIINADTENTGIHAHVIVPSTIDTPQNREAVPNADFSTWEKPKDIARIIGKYVEHPNKNKSALVVQEEL